MANQIRTRCGGSGAGGGGESKCCTYQDTCASMSMSSRQVHHLPLEFLCSTWNMLLIPLLLLGSLLLLFGTQSDVILDEH